MDPTAVLNIIYRTAVLIKKTVEDVKANQQQCKRLGERIDAINQCLRSLNDRDLKRSAIKQSLDNFRKCVQECLDFITQFKEKTSWFVRVFKNQNHKEQFQELNLQLSQCANDLNLGINLTQLFDAKIDENDQKTDLNIIESKIDDIAQLMEQMKEEQYNHYKGIEENIKQRLNSLKYNLQQDIIKIKDPAKAKEIAEEEHAFLHIPFHDLLQEKRIGQGGFADVYRGRWLSRDHEVAIKVIRIQFLDDRIKGDLVNEISMMHQIHYDHILNIFGACMEPNNYALIVEYMSLGSLYDILGQKLFQFTWSDRCSIANQMTKGINYLHKLPKPILHRDIKSLNILMTEHGKGFLVKVADFGLAKIRRETSRQSSSDPLVGTFPWKAPELLNMGRHTEASDVYALGIVFWELCTECEPYEEADDSTISAFVMRGARLAIRTNIPRQFADLISSAWAHEPKKRSTCQQILNLIKAIWSEIDENKISKKNVATSDETVSPQQRSQSPERSKKGQYEIGKFLNCHFVTENL
ncbi:unnamed protein product [Rotaria magnacalcarata]|uniref:Protein kinase domain-containing protein n=2 Tax=Rotaria magnacalcarata TaxID=392030 RepID=A0A816EXP1_9BILA|nr:unnamed protein product [Rotaria magnacalcarata]